MSKQVAYEVEKIIEKVVRGIDSVESKETDIRTDETRTTVHVTFLGDRGGDKFFTPRQDEEDDDFPNFTGRGRIIAGLKKYLGKQCSINAYEQEKGWFTVSVVVPKSTISAK